MVAVLWVYHQLAYEQGVLFPFTPDRANDKTLFRL